MELRLTCFMLAVTFLYAPMCESSLTESLQSILDTLAQIRTQGLPVALPLVTEMNYHRKSIGPPVGDVIGDDGKRHPVAPTNSTATKKMPKTVVVPRNDTELAPMPVDEDMTATVEVIPPSYDESYTVTLGYSADASLQVVKGHDALPLFNKAINLLQKNGGGVWQIEEGVYNLSGPMWVLSGNILIQGAGMHKTVIRLADMAPGPWEYAGFFRAVGVVNLTVMDLTLDGNKEHQDPNEELHYGRYGIYMDTYHNVLFERVATNNFQRYGFDPHGIKRGGRFIWSYGFTVIDCVSMNNNWDGFTFDQTFHIYARNNTAIRNGRHGFNVCTGARYAVFEGNRAIYNGFGQANISHGGSGCGFMTDHLLEEGCKCPGFPYDTRDIVYRDNEVHGAHEGGFCIQRSANVTLFHNKVTDAKYCGLFFNEATNGTWEKNACVNTTEAVAFQNMTAGAQDSIRIRF